MKQLKTYSPIALLFCWLIFVQLKCNNWEFLSDEMGIRPVYADSLKIHTVQVEAPRSLRNSGKIYYKDSTIYIIERDSGIHVIDNRQPQTPRSLRFIKLMGCRDIAIKGSILYADNFTDLVTIDVANPEQPRMLNRLRGVYPAGENGQPTARYKGELYQCIDSSKGKVVAWEYGTIDSTKCFKRL
jgi:hypothetical protein